MIDQTHAADKMQKMTRDSTQHNKNNHAKILEHSLTMNL